MLAFFLILINHGCMSMEGSRNFLSIHEAFAETEHGRTLAANVRYETYKPIEVSNERWEELLGPDVNNLEHMAVTYGITEVFISHSERLQPGIFSRRDKALLGIGAFIHDRAESITTDKNYSEKTETDEAEERQVFIDNLSDFDTSDTVEISELINEAVQNVIFDKESRLGRIFNLIERIGYLRTALRANEHIYAGSAPDCEAGLRWLVTDVLSNHHTTHLIAVHAKLAAVGHFLESHHDRLAQAFEMANPDIFADNLEPAEAATRKKAFLHARSVWDFWGDEFNPFA